MVKKKNHRYGVGLGIAGAAALAAAGAYFLYGKDGAKNRKIVKGWALKAKGEVLEKMEELGSISKEAYERIVDRVGEKYSHVRSVNKKDLGKLVRELKSQWNSIVKEASKKRKSVKR